MSPYSPRWTSGTAPAASRPRWAKAAALLQTMPGLGLITVLTILAELGDIQRFPYRASVSNFAGLVSVIQDSNEKHYAGGITHRGPAHLRAALVEAAWMACPRVPRYQALYQRVGERRGKQVAIVAVARQMMEDAWVMLKKEEAFRYAPAWPWAPRYERQAEAPLGLSRGRTRQQGRAPT